jgi:acyl dehydratase
MTGTAPPGSAHPRELVVVADLSRTQIVQYAGASGDFNPAHTDEVYARDVAGYPGVFAHGMLVMGMSARILTDWFGDDRLIVYDARFVRQVWPGDTLTATASMSDTGGDPASGLADVSVVTRNQAGEVVLTAQAQLAVSMSCEAWRLLRGQVE